MKSIAPELPDGIINHILSFLPIEEAIQTSLISKAWLSASSQLPNLQLSHHRFFSRENFTKFVTTTLLRQTTHNLPLHNLQLFSPILDKITLDFWLRIAFHKGVKHLFISLSSVVKNMNINNATTYTLPQSIFTSDSLISLELQDPIVQNLPHSIRFSLAKRVQMKSCHTLKRLHLKRVRLMDSTIRRLSSVFPFLEELGIDDCFLLDDITILNFDKLKKVYIRSFLVNIDIIAVKSLKSFTFVGQDYFCHQMHYISSYYPCPSLKHLRLENSSITDSNFEFLLSHCPSLEELVLTYCTFLERINVSSHTLKQMELSYNHNLEEVKIDAPNLLSLDYVCGTFPSFSLTSVSENFVPCVHVDTDIGIDIDTTFMINLRGLLTQLNLSRICLTIKCLENFFSFEEIRMVPIRYPRPRIKNVEVDIGTSSVSSSVLLEGLFWSFRPENLTVFYTSDENLELIKLICKEIMDRSSSNCCSSNQIMCWRHYLTHADVNYLDQKSANQHMIWQPLDLKSLVDGSFSLREGSEVCLTLIW